MDYQAVLAAVEALPVDERERLVDEVQGRLMDRTRELEATPEFQAELIRLGEELENNPELGVTWEVVRAEMRRRVGR